MSTPQTQPESAYPAWVTWLAIAWLLGFGWIFFGLDLPNTNPPVNRSDIWAELSNILYDCVIQNPDPGATVLSWTHFPQRLSIIGTGVFIFMGACGLGHILLRSLRLELDEWSLERHVLGAGLGLSAVSLLTLGCGLLARSIPGALSSSVLGGSLLVCILVEAVLRSLSRRSRIGPSESRKAGSSGATWHEVLLRGQIPFPVLIRIALGVVIGLFVVAMALGAMLPSIDFDVKEYHLQGPKEWYQSGAVTLLAHNVYTSFPFLTEMFTLLGMVLTDDWQRGALVGKLVLMTFAPLTTLGVFALARRWFDSRIAWTAALIHTSTPWTYRISVIAYAEGGLTFFLLATLLAVLLAIDTDDSRERLKRTFLAGLLAGSAMACKYPGVLSVVIPLGGALLWTQWRTRSDTQPARRLAMISLTFATGCALTVGPWLLKNLAETGNPVYPLLNSVFHGSDWTPTLEANWKQGHSPPHHDLADLPVKMFDVTFKSDWLSPLLFSMAPLAFLVTHRRGLIRGLWIYLGFLFISWWVLTHRIDRFWIPLIPVASVLAGAGVWWTSNKIWKCAAGTAVALCVLFNLAFISTPYCGLNAWLGDYDELWDTTQTTASTVQAVNNLKLPADSKVLCVGEAQVFDAQFPLVYNTVFDISIFEQWCSADEPGIEPGNQPLKPPGQIDQKLRDEGVTHVLVNWAEILRYRMTYGYADFVAPRRFAELLQSGVLVPGPPLTRPRSLASFRSDERDELRRWAPELILDNGDEPVVFTSQLFFVRSTMKF